MIPNQYTTALFTPVKYIHVGRPDFSFLTLENAKLMVDRVEASIQEVLDAETCNGVLYKERSQELTRLLSLAPGNLIKPGRLTVAARKVIEAVVGEPSRIYAMDLWAAAWSHIRPKNPAAPTSCSSRQTFEQNIREVEILMDWAHIEAKAREVILRKYRETSEPRFGDALVLNDVSGIINLAEAVLHDEALAEQFPEGTSVCIDFCEGCDTWTVGERRCDCGNVRVYLESSGPFLKGRGFLYPQRG